MLPLLALLTTARSECPATIPPRAVVETVVRGEVAFQNGDADGLSAAANEARAQIPCLGAPMGLGDTAAVFRLWGYAAFVGRDRESAARLLGIAKDLEPDYRMPPVVVPEHHPMRALYEELTPRAPATRLIELPKGDTAVVNGIESVVVPTDQPYVYQQIGPDGRVRQSALVGTGQAPPVLAGPPKRSAEWGLSVLGCAQSWVRKGRTTLTVGPAVRVDVPLMGPLGADVRVAAGLSAVAEGVVLVPDLRAGARYRLAGDIQPRFGAAALFASHSGAVVAPGGALTGGLQTGGLDVDVTVGYAGGVTGGVAFGAVLR